MSVTNNSEVLIPGLKEWGNTVALIVPHISRERLYTISENQRRIVKSDATIFAPEEIYLSPTQTVITQSQYSSYIRYFDFIYYVCDERDWITMSFVDQLMKCTSSGSKPTLLRIPASKEIIEEANDMARGKVFPIYPFK